MPEDRRRPAITRRRPITARTITAMGPITAGLITAGPITAAIGTVTGKSRERSDLVLRRLDVETVQDAVKDRRQHDAGGDDDNETGQNCVGSGENLSGRRFQFA